MRRLRLFIGILRIYYIITGSARKGIKWEIVTKSGGIPYISGLGRGQDGIYDTGSGVLGEGCGRRGTARRGHRALRAGLSEVPAGNPSAALRRPPFPLAREAKARRMGLTSYPGVGRAGAQYAQAHLNRRTHRILRGKEARSGKSHLPLCINSLAAWENDSGYPREALRGLLVTLSTGGA